QPLEGLAAVCARHCDEPHRPPARRWRRSHQGGPPPRQPTGKGSEGRPYPQASQAVELGHRAASPIATLRATETTREIEIPNSKHQIPNKIRSTNDQGFVLSFGFGICLRLGASYFEFGEELQAVRDWASKYGTFAQEGPLCGPQAVRESGAPQPAPR